MLIDFNEINSMTIPGMNNGIGTMTAQMYKSNIIFSLRNQSFQIIIIEYTMRKR